MSRYGSRAALTPQRRYQRPLGTAERPSSVQGHSRTLAHRGVLLLDELPELQRPVLEALRQSLEDGTIAVARASGHAIFPGEVPARRDDEPLS